jgi:hypothetical protein
MLPHDQSNFPGNLHEDAFQNPNRLNGFFDAMVDHIDVPEKGNVIVDLAGLPPTLKQRALDTVSGRLNFRVKVRTNVELALDNGKKLILLDD